MLFIIPTSDNNVRITQYILLRTVCNILTKIGSRVIFYDYFLSSTGHCSTYLSQSW